MSANRQLSRRRRSEERAALRRIPLLADIDNEQLDRLLGALDRRHIPASEWLFRAGDPSNTIYVVDYGRFIAVGADGQVIREMASGDSIGELGVIAGTARSAGVQALRDSVVWGIAADAFRAVLATTPRLQLVMLRAMAMMLRESRSRNASGRPRVIGILSAGSAAPVGQIADTMATQLRSYGKVAVIAAPTSISNAAENFSELVGAFSESLGRAERSNDWVLVVADRDAGDLWRRQVAAQCDRLVVLVDETRPPKAIGLLPKRGPVHLMTCTADPGPSWWDLPQVVSHHPANDDGIGALIRRIAGRSLGLVMAGGGARGLTHFGVYEELTRAGVVIDRFGGTSSGAIAAAAFALGMDAQDAITIGREFIAQNNPLGDYTIPAVALTRGRRVELLAERICGETLIEHLPKAFFCVSADMITGDQIIHRRGPLGTAVRASISIPGILPPVQRGDEILVDGGLLNNLPADVMCADPDGEVICVDLRRKYVPSKGFGLLPPIVPLPGFVRRLLTGTDVALPPLQETLLRAFELAASSANPRELPRVAAVIEPDVSAIGPLDFDQIDAALDAGRIATRSALKAYPQLVG
ncbi:patatin-like phospholipase family protein [Mycobacterium decipiens]|uniref:Esterase n=1 Tax=Mycobacterium decipiens TaxID=1430326 RepID=A0A1X2LWY0_9MYCO|nr:patatin-like phospholipase family protein [Mycobacterium decipiens]OSC41673.1 esterase [Mycobacterium decipiens]